MEKPNPYKRTALGFLLGFCYPQDGVLGIWDHSTLAAYPKTAALRETVIDVLRAYINRQHQKKDSITVLEEAQNEPVTVLRSINVRSDRPSLRVHNTSVGRLISDHLLNYLDADGPDYGSICQQCGKVYLMLKPNQNYCTEQCRWKFWNAKKMEGYYADKAKASRAHNKRLKAKGVKTK